MASSIVTHAANHRRGEFGLSSSSPSPLPKSPSRDAAIALWGADTPLKDKGELPPHTRAQLERAGKWMCLTCLYAENPSSAAECTVCGGPNPAAQAGSAKVTLECPVCHFVNSEYAARCNMCSRVLTGSNAVRSAMSPEDADRDVERRSSRRRDDDGILDGRPRWDGD